MTSIIRLLTLLLLCLVPVHAMAQPPAQPTADEVSRAHFEQGKTLAASGKYADAYREFEAGYKANPRPAFLFNMGEAARGMGDFAKARAAYNQFLAAEPTGAVADTARQRLAEFDRPVVGPQPPTAPPVTDQKATPKVGPPVPTPRQVAESRANAGGSVIVQPRQPMTEQRPIWKKWPFWAAIGGVVMATVVIASISAGNDIDCRAGCIDLR